MKRSDWLNLAQGLLIFGQTINAGLATMHASAIIALLVGGGISAMQFVVHQYTMDTEPPK